MQFPRLVLSKSVSESVVLRADDCSGGDGPQSIVLTVASSSLPCVRGLSQLHNMYAYRCRRVAAELRGDRADRVSVR